MGFTAEFVDKSRSGAYSHAQLVDAFADQPVILKNLKVPHPFDEVSRSLVGIRAQAAALEADQARALADEPPVRYPDGSVLHNEVVSRLYLWEAVAVEVGPDVSEGLCAAIELQIARKSLTLELERAGTDHPLFQEFCLQQLSAMTLPRRDHNQTVQCQQALNAQEKEAALSALLERLQSDVSLCRYVPAAATIEGLAEREVKPVHVLAALDRVLSARLGPDGLKATETVRLPGGNVQPVPDVRLLRSRL